MAGKTSKFFRVATEGATTDGRAITRTDIEQMAKNYDPKKKYGARINMEHYRSLLPDSPFRMYGDVLAVEARDVEDGKKALFAQIDPTDDLVDMVNVKRQKVYSSIEIDPSFSDTGEAYLKAIAVTDNPASLGTEMLQFAAGAKVSPFAARKQDPGNLFSEAVEFTLELEDDSTGKVLLEGFSAKIKELLKFKSKQADGNFSEIKDAVELIADSQRTVLEQFATIQQQDTTITKLTANLEKLSGDHAELVKKLSAEPNSTPREKTPGGHAGTALTDC